MPPKSKLEQIRLGLKKQQQSPKEITSTKKEKERLPTRTQQVRVVAQEDVKVRKFFKQLETVPDNKVPDAIRTFAQDSTGAWGRKKFFKTMLEILPSDQYKEFTEAYINQTNRNLQQFWTYYTNLPAIQLEIRKKQEYEDEAALERRAMKEMYEEGTEIDEEENIIPYGPRPKPTLHPDYPKERRSTKTVVIGGTRTTGLRTTKWLRDNAEAIGAPRGTYTEVDKPVIRNVKLTRYPYDANTKCIEMYKQMPWLNAGNVKVYLSPVEGDFSASPYMLDDPLEKNGIIWYRASRSFFDLMCNKNSKLRQQDGEVLTAFTNDGEPIRMMVGYDTNRGFIVQDKAVFDDELAYLQFQRKTKQTKIEDLLDQNINPLATRICTTKLSQALHKAAPNVKDYGIYPKTIDDGEPKYDTAYIVKAISIISSESVTVRDMAARVADIVVYLEMSEKSQEIFKKRIVDEYYSPEILVSLSPEEKLPEYFEYTNIKPLELEAVVNTINAEISRMIYNIGLSIYQNENPTERTYPETVPTYVLPKVKKWMKECVNYADVEYERPENVVYYKEDGKTYCLRIGDISEQIFFEPIPVNPYTNKPLSNTFLERFEEVYLSNINIPDIVEQPVEDVAIPVRAPLAPDLLSIIIQNLDECEQSFNPEVPQNPDLSFLEGQYSPLPVKNDSDVDEDTESSVSSESSMSTESSVSTDVVENVETCDMCCHCDKKLETSNLKTKIDKGNEGFKTVHFCSFRCFEDHDKWPQTKKRKNMSGKSGGRNSTKERKS